MKEEWKVYAEVVASQAKRWPDKCGHHRNLWCVSNLGNFKIMYNYKDQEKIQVPSRSGGWKGMYLHIATPAGGYREHFCHRIVALNFVDNPDPTTKLIVHHRNGNKLDNRASNLEWTTYKENMAYYYEAKKLSKIY